jgi:hypothetical protein
MKFGAGDQKLPSQENPLCLFGIWRVLKRLRLISGKAMLFSRQNGQILILGISPESKAYRSGGKLADGTLQGMIIP